jgi:hypothetical protein
MASYRYLLADLLSNQILTELPLTSVNFTQIINSAGTMTGTILLSGLPVAANVTNATIPAKSAIYIDRDGVIVWGGIIWARTYSSTSQHLQISAREFESYFERRRITTTAFYFSVDQLSIAQGLVSSAQAVPSGNIGVVVGSATSGYLTTKQYRSYEQKTVLSALQDLARAGTGGTTNAGFDFAIRCAYDSAGSVVKTLALGAPRLGNVYSSTSTTTPVFEFPSGNVLEYEYPEDGSIVANTIYATGAGSNEGKIIYSGIDTTKLAQGWPLLEDTASYTDIDNATLIQNLANGQVAAVSYPPTILKIVTSPALDPVLGTYAIGDDARIRITDDRFPNGLDAIYRIVGLTVTPGETSPERATLTLSLPTSS